MDIAPGCNYSMRTKFRLGAIPGLKMSYSGQREPLSAYLRKTNSGLRGTFCTKENIPMSHARKRPSQVLKDPLQASDDSFYI